jgi:hypothetical protein
LALRHPSIVEERAVKLGWVSNKWYWLRLRHELDAGDGAPGFKARSWPADGETREPRVWQVSWDYYPSDPARMGVGHALNLFGAPHQGYTIELTSDWRQWSSQLVFTDALGFAHAGALLEHMPEAQFYRAKVTE